MQMSPFFQLHKNQPQHHASPPALLQLGKVMKDVVQAITKPGKAPEHKKGPILPHHNLFKPGAHPVHKNKDHDKKHDQINKDKDHKEAAKNATVPATKKDAIKAEDKKEATKQPEVKAPQKIN